jgi:hypothetical protein
VAIDGQSVRPAGGDGRQPVRRLARTAPGGRFRLALSRAR